MKLHLQSLDKLDAPLVVTFEDGSRLEIADHPASDLAQLVMALQSQAVEIHTPTQLAAVACAHYVQAAKKYQRLAVDVPARIFELAKK